MFMTSAAMSQFVETPRQNVIISGQIHGFWEYLPADYFSNPTKTYPLIVGWHGVGEVGNGALPSMQLLLIHGIPRVIEWNIFPQSVSFNGQSYSFIVLNPQYMGPGVGVADMDAFLNYAFNNYRVDRNRVYLTGYSLGAMLCYDYAGNNSTYARKITGIVPLAPCGDGNFDDARTIAANNVAVWGIHGNGDIQCPWQYTLNWSNLINSANGAPPVPAAVSSLTPGLNPGDPHDIFWFTYEQGFSAPPPNKNIYNWMIQYARTTALPITLKSFSAEYRDKITIVEWITTNESNTKEFKVERAGKDLQFRTLATIPASGSAISDRNYKWVDDLPIEGINYYRLQLVNLDNTKEYFEIRKVIATRDSKVTLLSSNPVKESIKLNMDLDRKQKLIISITDVQGRILYKKSASYPQGKQEIVFNPPALPPGSYLLKVRGDSFTEAIKIIRQ